MNNAIDQLKTVGSRAITGFFSIAAGDSGTKTVVTAPQTTPTDFPLIHTIYVQKIRVIVRTGSAGITWTFQDSNGTPVPVGNPTLDVSVTGEQILDFGPQGQKLTDNKNLTVVLSGAGAAGDIFVEGYMLPLLAVNNAIPSFASISPATGSTAGGTAVTITGAGFRTGATVAIGGVSCTRVVVISPQEILAVTGAHGAGAVNVVVTNPAPNGSETVTGAGAYTYA